MTLTILMTVSVLLSLSFSMLSHPLTMGVTLLMQTLVITVASGILNMSFWYSYIMFLIMIGGMMVLFIYMTSVASNEKFKFSMTVMLLWTSTPFIMLTSYWFDIHLILPHLNQESLTNPIPLINESMTKFINQPTNLIMFMTIIYLLITMIAVVKITYSSGGALRQKK